MKALVVLALVGLAAAKPQYLWYNNPLVTVKAAEEGSIPTINHYTASYPFNTPLTYTYPYSGLPGAFPFHFPVVAAAKPVEEAPAVARAKRDAEPDPQLISTSGLVYNPAVTSYTIPTTAGIIPSTYTIPTTAGIIPSPYTIPTTAGIIPSPYTYPTTAGIIPSPYTYPNVYTGLNNPFSSFPFGNPFVAAKAAAEEPAVEASRKKRSADPEADPEADPQLLLNNAANTGFVYPSVNTYTNPLTYTYSPTTFPRLATTYASPNIYSYPFNHAWGK